MFCNASYKKQRDSRNILAVVDWLFLGGLENNLIVPPFINNYNVNWWLIHSHYENYSWKSIVDRQIFRCGQKVIYFSKYVQNLKLQ